MNATDRNGNLLSYGDYVRFEYRCVDKSGKLKLFMSIGRIRSLEMSTYNHIIYARIITDFSQGGALGFTERNASYIEKLSDTDLSAFLISEGEIIIE